MAYLLLALASPAVLAMNQIVILGLFKDKAIVTIDGKQRSLSKGETSPEGVTLISANSDAAVLEIAGQQAAYPLGDQTTYLPAAADQAFAQIWPDSQGMYAVAGSINGLPVNFLVDTGATLVAMNAAEATRLGIDYHGGGQEVVVNTASGVAPAYQIELKRVKVGAIELHNVAAVVLDGPGPAQVLLGMSFLGRLELRNESGMMELKEK